MEENIEKWLSLKFLGYPDYEVSTLGNVKSLNYNHTGKEKILKPSKNNKGYLYVGLWKDGKKKTFSVHRIVASAFLENPEHLPCVNHKNEIKTDNRVENLEFCNILYNNCYGTKKQRLSESMKGKGNKPILQYTKDMVFIKEWESIKQASEELNIHKQNISKCCKNKRKSVGNYIWKYKEY